jgi:hypothetical protein
MPELAPSGKRVLKVNYWIMISTIALGSILFNTFVDPQIRRFTGGL